jgi:3-oxoacyl-[acyl-carrier protein] reductase
VAERVAILTGASRGVGLAAAKALQREGYRVGITARKEEGVRAAERELQSGGEALAFPGHAGDAGHRAHVVAATLAEYSRIDLLVNNVGIGPSADDLVDLDLDLARKILDTNVVAMLGWIQEVVRNWMGEHGGAIVNTLSVGAFQPYAHAGMYATSKAAGMMLTRQLAAELAPGIRVNAVAPAALKTRFGEPLYRGREDEVAARYPQKRLGTPEDVAGAIVFLASDQALWITGSTLVIDGGRLAVPLD